MSKSNQDENDIFKMNNTINDVRNFLHIDGNKNPFLYSYSNLLYEKNSYCLNYFYKNNKNAVVLLFTQYLESKKDYYYNHKNRLKNLLEKES